MPKEEPLIPQVGLTYATTQWALVGFVSEDTRAQRCRRRVLPIKDVVQKDQVG